MKIQSMHPSSRPREKALEYGIGSLSDRELLALFIRTGTQKKSALELADDVLSRCDELQRFSEMTLNDFCSIDGIKTAKGIELMAVMELSKRIVKPRIGSSVSIHEPQALVAWVNREVGYAEQENFLVIFLNNQNNLLGHEILFKGTVDHSVVHPRDIIREAVARNASRIILAHNHPGGTMVASYADKEVTEIMVRAGNLVGIEILDHIIVGQGAYISLKSQHPYLFEE